MEDLINQLLSTARAMWRRRWYGFGAAALFALIGAVALWRLPDRFEAVARVYVDTKTVLRPLMRDLAVEPEFEQAVGMLARTLISRPTIEQLLQSSFPGADSLSPAERNAKVESLMREIRLSGTGRENLYEFSYRDVDPDQANRVVNNLVAKFVETGANSKQKDSESARGFIDDQIKAYEERLSEAESRLKDFKLRNMGSLDSPNRDFFGRISTMSEELNKLTLELRASEKSREALKRELEGEVLTLVPDTATLDLPVQTPELDARLDTQRKQLDDLLRRYTDLHPDVVATRRLISRLEEQREQLRQDEIKRRATLPKSTARNSQQGEVAQRVRLALAEAEASVASLRVRVGDTQSRLAQLRASANRVPQIEAELAQLNRDYDVVRRNYEALVSRREKAAISEDVDATRSAQFRIIDAPRASMKPVFPTRMVLAPAMLLAALLGGVLVSFLVVQIAPTVDDSRALRMLSQRPVLGSVSMLGGGRVGFGGLGSSLAFASALGAVAAVFGAWALWLTSHVRG